MTQTSSKNPYRPGVGTKLLYVAGRDQEKRIFRKTLEAAPEIAGNVRLTGLRGVGKSVLLTEFQDIAGELDWVSAKMDIQPWHNQSAALVVDLKTLLDQTHRNFSRSAKVRATLGKTVAAAARSIKVTWQDVEVSVVPGTTDEAIDLTRSLYDVAEAAMNSGRLGFLLMLDEFQVLRDERGRDGEHPLSLLLTAFVSLQQVEVPVGLVVCGLPTLKTNLLKARSYSERMFRGMDIGSLKVPEAIDAFVKPLDNTGRTARPDLVQEVVDTVECYPYFIQLWGAELWDAAVDADLDEFTIDLLNATSESIYERIDSGFYEPRIDSLSPAERDVLLSTGLCHYPPIRVAELNQRSKKSPGNVNVILGQLVEAGVIYRVRKGEYLYTAPKFGEFLSRYLKKLPQ